MPSPYAERAIEEALAHGKAILKFISPNNVGITGSHECGFYLPKNAWKLFSPHPPTKGANADSFPKVTWQDGRVTDSRVTWYGTGTRSEYRLTRFGKDFPFLSPDCVGDLLVLVPKSHDEFSAYVLDLDEDIEEIQTALGVEALAKAPAVYDAESTAPPETENECIERHFREFVASLKFFPKTLEFSKTTQKALEDCARNFLTWNADKRLSALIRSEYDLFRMAERFLCQPEVQRLFKTVDDFLKTAQTILQRRRSRAGWSLEHHFEYLLKTSGVSFDIRPNVDGEPDVIIPSKEAYNDPDFPVSKLCMVGLKTTCKDRWRQVLNEAARIPQKHILTLQKGISSKQLEQMTKANVRLIVPQDLHSEYPAEYRPQLLTVEAFLASALGGAA